jgi:hypothetical protein
MTIVHFTGADFPNDAGNRRYMPIKVSRVRRVFEFIALIAATLALLLAPGISRADDFYIDSSVASDGTTLNFSVASSPIVHANDSVTFIEVIDYEGGKRIRALTVANCRTLEAIIVKSATFQNEADTRPVWNTEPSPLMKMARESVGGEAVTFACNH